MYKTWMMKTLLLSASLAMLVACNEKIAPELADPASTTTTSGSGGGGPTSTLTENGFRLELDNTPNGVNPTLLGYTLHKANELGTVSCEVEDVTDVPDTLNSTRDITCFMEAEEFALQFNGFKIKAVSDADTCNFISTQPYTYYNLQPGATARKDGSPREVVKFVCTDTALQSFGSGDLYADVAPAPAPGTNSSGFTTVSSLCGKYVNIDGTSPATFGTLDLSATSAPVALDSEDELCSFNYVVDNTEVNCDEGQVRIHTVNVATAADGSTPPVQILTAITGGSVLKECGGKIRNCIGGPAPEIIGETDFIDRGKDNVVTSIPLAGGTTDDISVNGNINRAYNVYFSNFMRQCSGVPNFTTPANFNTAPVFSPGYDADVMEEYVRLGTSPENNGITQEKDRIHDQFDVIYLADDPFRAGLPDSLLAFGDIRTKWNNSNLKAQPFYTYECLDQALDVKARIRLVVREWNRNFSPSSQEFRFVSDVFSGTARMDAGSAQTNPYLIYDRFNDVADWDDLLTFTNSPTNSCALQTTDPLVAPFRSVLWFPSEIEID